MDLLVDLAQIEGLHQVVMPSVIASIAVSLVPPAVMKITGSRGSISWIWRKTSSPEVPGSMMSKRTTSGWC